MIKDMGIILIYEELDVQSVQNLMNVNEPANSVAAMRDYLPNGDDEPVVYLSIFEGETSIDLLFASDNWEEERKVSIIRE